jgi:hypothetical protein
VSPRNLVAALLLIATAAACGGGDDDDDGSGGSGGTAGGATAGSPNGGATAGGSSGGGGSPTAGKTNGGNTNQSGSGGSGTAGGQAGSGQAGGTSTGAHCSPGTPQPSSNFFGGIIDQCASVEGLSGDVNHILDIELSKPVGPGETFAFSVDLGAPEGDFEMYGATAECGAVGEKLSTVHVTGNGIICHQVKPTSGTYSHMIWVWRVRAEMKDAAICESGTCSSK